MLINPIITGVIVILVAYLLGSVPSAYIVTKIIKKEDIRKLGGGNVGLTNVMHQVGIWPAVIVAVFDIGKGIVAVLIGKLLGVDTLWVLGAGYAAIIGHCYPIYIGFRGGRGVATTIGVFLILSPIVTGITVGIILLVLLLSRNIFFSVVVCSPFFLLALWLVNKSPALMVFAAAVVIFMAFKSRRAFKGTMSNVAKKFGRNKNTPS